MAYLNDNKFIGNIGKDVEVKTFDNEEKVGRTSLAVTKKFKKQDGSKGEKTIWLNLVFPSHLVENASKLVTKGRMVLIEAELDIREYEKDGAKQLFHEFRVENFQLLDKPKEDAD